MAGGVERGGNAIGAANSPAPVPLKINMGTTRVACSEDYVLFGVAVHIGHVNIEGGEKRSRKGLRGSEPAPFPKKRYMVIGLPEPSLSATTSR